MEVSRLLSLDDPVALDADLVGVKAARLAEARLRGFPVLPALIVPVPEGGRAIEAGCSALAGRGLAAARSEVEAHHLNDQLLRELAIVGELGPLLVVRSSTQFDDDGAFAGSFASYGDIASDEVPTAVRGCWASVFGPDSLMRLDRRGRGPEDVGLAVLIQRQIQPRAGGWARVREGWVELAATGGAPGPLLSGWQPGFRMAVTEEGYVTGPQAELPVDRDALLGVAQAAFLAWRKLGADRLEWAIDAGGIRILQLARLHAFRQPLPVAAAPAPAFTAPAHRSYARVLLGRRGRLADTLLGPWAAAAPEGCAPVAVDGDPVVLFELAVRIAAELGRTVAASAGGNLATVLDRLSAGGAEMASRLSATTIDLTLAGCLLGALERVAATLIEYGALHWPEEFWWQSPEWTRAALRRASALPPPAGWVGDRSTDLIFGTVVGNGARRVGVGASPGRAVGEAARVAHPEDWVSFRPGQVLVATSPVPNLAPLLWRASALVTLTGSPGAHLCEVARALRIPAVVSVDLGEASGSAIAVDGASGDVWVWDT